MSEPQSTSSRDGVFSRAIRLGVLVVPYAAAAWLDVTICPVALVGRIPCPGCGMTRAALALAHGDVHAATRMNPLAIVVVPMSAVLFCFGAFHYLRDGRTRLGELWPTIAGAGVGVALAIVWALRWFGLFGGPVAI
jgi:hypothetical protein